MGWSPARAHVVVEPRSNVLPLRRRDGSGPAVQPELFDRERVGEDLAPLSKIERELIASLLNTARPHLPSPRAVDDAIELLIGRRRP